MEINLPDPLFLVGILVVLGLAPFVAIMVTSYVKLVVVMSLIRNALGIQQIPPNMVINGMAIILTIYIMNPTIQQTYEAIRSARGELDTNDPDSLGAMVESGGGPIREFLLKHASERERLFFYNSAKKLWPEDRQADLQTDDLMVLVPAFTVTERIGGKLYNYALGIFEAITSVQL